MKDSRTSKELKQDAGSKYDREKLRMDLIPGSAVEGLAEVLTYGANKYADNNWRAGISWSRLFGATMRHLWAWYRGEDLDRESNLPHLLHAMCNIAFLHEFSVTRKEYDDRITGTICSYRHPLSRPAHVSGPTQNQQVPASLLAGKNRLDGPQTTEPSWEDEAPEHPEKQNPSNCSDSSWGV